MLIAFETVRWIATLLSQDIDFTLTRFSILHDTYISVNIFLLKQVR
jgi:hypothetical protein